MDSGGTLKLAPVTQLAPKIPERCQAIPERLLWPISTLGLVGEFAAEKLAASCVPNARSWPEPRMLA